MREPKYKLNKKDDARWYELLTRDCAQYPVKPGDKAVPNPKYPPLTPVEAKEFERLQRKRCRKVRSHPRVQESLRHQHNHDRKIQRLLKKLNLLTSKLNETKPKS
jgi:hypothetical protein